MAMAGTYALINLSLIRHYVARVDVTPHAVAVFLLLYAVSGISLGVLLMSLNRYLAFAVFLPLIACVTTNHLASHLLFHLRVIDSGTAEWLLSETGQTTAAVRQFFGPFAEELTISVASMLPIMIVARLARHRLGVPMKHSVSLTAAALVCYGLSGMAIQREFDPNLPLENNLLLYRAKMWLKSPPNIPPVDLRPVGQPQVEKILLVVDESVTYSAYRTQLRNRWILWNGVDYGDALSLGNTSTSGNSMLRWGFRAREMLAGKDPRVVPTIWSYAHAAGFRTVFVDGQRNGSYQNYMNRKEVALIDQIIGVDDGFDTDHTIAALLRTLMRKPGKMFVYVNKRGSHFPYDDNYPNNGLQPPATPEESYDAAVRYTTEDFLDRALAGVQLTNVLMVYTSDHGEQFGGGPGHGNIVPRREEKSVPLLLLTGNAALQQKAIQAASVLRDRAGHEQIFATLLGAMGYDLRAAETIYGSSLLSPSVPQHYYHVLATPIPSRSQAVTAVEFRRDPYQAPRFPYPSAMTAVTSH
jgi:hypothetical protein